MDKETVIVTPFTADLRDKLISMIVNIQQNEFNLPISAEDQPDLFDIENFYQQGNGNFWIALHNDEVVGSIALIDIGNQEAALRKMFVHKDYRGKETGTAHKLIDSLLAWSKERSVQNIYLGTTKKMHAAQRFYTNKGFVEIERSQLPDSFPVMEVDSKFYVLT
ncbi:MAG: GNAT family N-acetyltransferase [Sulfurospirillaceae bacterium]|nr:GNAT family N-acetyltransferase [Sulfurospirillaceae bacterium]